MLHAEELLARRDPLLQVIPADSGPLGLRLHERDLGCSFGRPVESKAGEGPFQHGQGGRGDAVSDHFAASQFRCDWHNRILEGKVGSGKWKMRVWGKRGCPM